MRHGDPLWGITKWYGPETQNARLKGEALSQTRTIIVGPGEQSSFWRKIRMTRFRCIQTGEDRNRRHDVNHSLEFCAAASTFCGTMDGVPSVQVRKR